MGWGYWRNEKERFAANCTFIVTCENGHTQELSAMGLKKRLVEGFRGTLVFCGECGMNYKKVKSLTHLSPS
jgi:hypothetical protein